MKRLIISAVMLLSACQTVTDTHPDPARPSVQVHRIDTTQHTSGLYCSKAVKAFYGKRALTPYWSSGETLLPLGDSLLAVLHASHLYGLIPEHYHLVELDLLLNDSTVQDRLQRIDVLLSDAYLTFYNHLKVGRLDAAMQFRGWANDESLDAVESLMGLNSTSLKSTFARLEPAHIQYHHLKRALGDLVVMPDRDSVQQGHIVTLSLNMERWRAEKQWPDRYVVVNIPAFTMRVVEADSVWLESRVVVGKRKTPTPVMESVIRSFLIYPYWHVPHSIATKEILPALQRDTLYLQRNNFQVLNKRGEVVLADTIQWDLYSATYFPFTLRQREGSENSMGIIKFNFSNRYGVYLHDTNSKRLYARPTRDFSHGCVRVEKAISLAHYLVREDDIYVSPEDLDQYLSLQQRLKIDLRKPITVKLVYFTAEVRNGLPVFYDDIYKKDSVMMRALYPVAPESTEGLAL